jgi:hypothetical protein
MTNENTEFQKIGDTMIVLNGSTSGVHHNQTFFRDYDVGFIKDGYEFLFVGKNLDEIKQDLISSYFSEYSIDDVIEYSDSL